MDIKGLIRVASDSRSQKIAELKALEADGVVLPMSISDILAVEQRGDVVDLDTGAIIKGGATQGISLTKFGRAQVE